jgi:hypothetical protein
VFSYAQQHYPFAPDSDRFLERFPADFVAEGIDQTRGWFYTLLVLGTALFDKAPFVNLVRFSFFIFCLEIVLANGFRILIRLWIFIIIFFRFDKLRIWIRLYI